MTTQVRPKKNNSGGHKGQIHGHSIGVPERPPLEKMNTKGAGPHEGQSHGHDGGEYLVPEHQRSFTAPVVSEATKPMNSTGAFTIKPAKSADGFGHSGSQKQGCLRMSGVSGAHRIGKRK